MAEVVSGSYLVGVAPLITFRVSTVDTPATVMMARSASAVGT